MKEKMKVEGFVECNEDEFEKTPKNDKLTICFGEEYTFLHFRRKKRRVSKHRSKK